MPRQAAAKESTGRDYAAYAEKPITQAMQDYHAWLQDVTGLKLDERAVALAGTLRMDFQKHMRETGSPRAHSNRGTAKPKAPAKATASKSTATKSTTTTKRAPAKATASKPAAATKSAAAPASKPAAKPRSGRRGAAAATAEAPY